MIMPKSMWGLFQEQLDRELDALLDGQQKLDMKMNSLQTVVYVLYTA